MKSKMNLAARIVTDFHSAEDAQRGREEFNRVVRRKEVPADIDTVPMPEGLRTDQGIRIDKLLAATGLASSGSDAVRKIRAGSVAVNGVKVDGMFLLTDDTDLVLHAGKKWVRVMG